MGIILLQTSQVFDGNVSGGQLVFLKRRRLRRKHLLILVHVAVKRVFEAYICIYFFFLQKP